MPVGLTTETALTAFFHLCVPVVSGGAIQQTFPAEQVVALTDKEKATYTDPSKPSGKYWRIKSPEGFILLNEQSPNCRIITEDDNPTAIKAAFLDELKIAGGKPFSTEESSPGAETTVAMIPLTAIRSVAISFTISLGKEDRGFFASAFLVEKNH